MKKLSIYNSFLLIIALSFSSVVSADITPPGSHLLNRCVKVINLDKFPDVSLIGYVTGPVVNGSETFIVKNSECLSAGYKFNSMSIYWNTKIKPTSIDTNNLLLKNIEWYGGDLDQNNPLAKEDVEYSIAGFSGGKPVLYKSKQTSEYNNGAPKKVETFSSPLGNKGTNEIVPAIPDQQVIAPTRPSPEPDRQVVAARPSPEPAKRGFWQSIICFFTGLFGNSCQ